MAFTKEEMDFLRKIEGIFSPYALRQREKKRIDDNPGVDDPMGCHIRFAHYTTADAALKIIQTKRLWMRNTTVMSDYREVTHGHDLLIEYFADAAKKAAFNTATDSVYAGAGQAALVQFDNWWNHIYLNTYITSTSSHYAREDIFGRLSMWRAFGNSSPRVALVLKLPVNTGAAPALGLVFSPVAYLGRYGAFAVLDEVIANILRETAFLKANFQPNDFQAAIFKTLVIAVCSTKHEGFWEEQEWRAVHSFAFNLPTLVEQAKEVVHGVPQTIFKIPLDGAKYPQIAALDLANILDRVIVGPTPFPAVMCESFVAALRDLGVPRAEDRVVWSQIPIRGP